MANTPFDQSQYVNVETFKKSGAGVKTPVWAAGVDGKLVFNTDVGSWKVKRIRNNPKVRLAACNGNGSKILGPWHEGTARVLDDAAAIARAEAALAKKYGLQRRLFYFFGTLFGRLKKENAAYIEIEVGGPVG